MNFLSKLSVEVLRSDCLWVSEQWDNFTQYVPPFNRFFYMLSGQARIWICGQALEMREGSAYILPAGVLHHLPPQPETFKKFYIHFKLLMPGGNDFFTFFNCPLEMPGGIVLEKLPDTWMADFISGAGVTILDDLNREAILRLLINPFIAEGIKRMNREKQFSLERFKKVITYIENHCHKPITIAKLASMIFLQPTYFSNLFRKHFGVSPYKYISLVRMNKAKHLLEHTHMQIQGVAEEVGYNDVLYFSRIFKQYVGRPPTAYRKQCRSIKHVMHNL